MYMPAGDAEMPTIARLHARNDQGLRHGVSDLEVQRGRGREHYRPLPTISPEERHEGRALQRVRRSGPRKLP